MTARRYLRDARPGILSNLAVRCTSWIVFTLLGIAATSFASAETRVANHGGTTVPRHEDIVAAGPEGALSGTLTLPAEDRPIADEVPVLLIVPGSGPTDRNGNSPLGISAAPYRLLAEALAERGYPSVRIDKRGMHGSAGAIPNPNDVTISAYGEDVLSWARAIRTRLPSQEDARCVIPLGHSEGGLVALASLTRLPDACGLILISSLGRPFDEVLREQLHANPANAAFLDEADRVLAQLKQGARIDAGALSPALQPLFGPEVQGFLIDAFSYDPVALAAEVEVPMLVVQGMRDLQVGEADARALASAAPDATLALLPEVNHVLKVVDPDDRSANLATYSDPALPIAPSVLDAVMQYLE